MNVIGAIHGFKIARRFWVMRIGMMIVKISEIRIGKRHRKDMGDIEGLARSIDQHGLLHPIAVTPETELICGRRRMAACEMLERSEIEATVVDIDDILYGERDENVCREDFSPSDAVAVAEAVEVREREKAKERERTHTDTGYVNFTDAEKGESKAKAAKAVGMSRPSLAKAQKIVAAAEEEPDKYGDILEKMDKSGKVDPAHKELKRRKREENRRQMSAGRSTDPNILTGDFREVGRSIADDTVDIIFTDPPYAEVCLYEALAGFAARVLKPGGICMVYTGHPYLPDVYTAMQKHLEYMWTCSVLHTGGIRKIWKYNIHVRWKPIVMYCKLPLDVWWQALLDVASGKEEKEGHDWQQAEAEAHHYIRTLCPKGGLVVDPMCGSGTTLVAAKKLGLNYIGIDIDHEPAEYAKGRLAGIDAT